MPVSVQLFARDRGAIDGGEAGFDADSAAADALLKRLEHDQTLTAWIDLQGVSIRDEQHLLNQRIGLPAVAVRGFQCLAGPSLEERAGHVLVRLDELDFYADTFDISLLPIGFFFTRRLLITRHVDASPCVDLYRRELQTRRAQTAATATATPSGIAVCLAGLLAGRYVTLLSSLETRLEQLGSPSGDAAALARYRSKLTRLHRALGQHGALFASLDALSLPFSDDVRQRLQRLQGYLHQALMIADRYRIAYGAAV